MDRRKIKWLCTLLVAMGLILLFLSAFIFPKYEVYSNLSIAVSFLIGLFAILYSSIYFLVFYKKNLKDSERCLKVLEENSMLKIDLYLFIVVLGMSALIFSTVFYNEKGDFLWVMGTIVLSVLIFVFIQYHKGLIKLYQQNNQNKNV